MKLPISAGLPENLTCTTAAGHKGREGSSMLDFQMFDPLFPKGALLVRMFIGKTGERSVGRMSAVK